MVLPFLPLYLQEMGVRSGLETWAGLIFGASFLSGGMMAPVWGGIGDRYGRKAMVLRSGISIATVNVLMALAGSPWQLLLLRTINGLLGGFLPAANALVASSVPLSYIGRGLGMMQVGAAVGTITGPLIGGILTDVIGVRRTFYAASFLVALATLLVHLFVDEQFQRRSAEAPASFTALFSGMGALLRIPGVRSVIVASLLIQAGATGVQPVMALFVHQISRNPASVQIGLVMAAAGLATILATPAWGLVSDRVNLRAMLVWTTAAAGLTTVLQGLTSSVDALIAARFAFGAAQSGANQAVNTLLARQVDGEARGLAYGLSSSAWMLGAVIGSVLGGWAAGMLGAGGAFWVCGVLLLGGAAWLHSRRSRLATRGA